MAMSRLARYSLLQWWTRRAMTESGQTLKTLLIMFFTRLGD